MQHLSLEGAPICFLIVQDNVFITMLEGAILYLYGIQTSRETSHIPSKAQPVGTVMAGHPKSKVTTLQEAGNPTLDPSHLYSFHWGVGGQRDRQEAPWLCLLNLNAFTINSQG